MRTKGVAALAVALTLAGCANTGADYRPLVDPYASRGSAAGYEADLSACQGYARQTAGAAEAAVIGAVLGALLGAAVGRGFGHNMTGYGAGVGALSGAAGGAGGGETNQRDVIRRCMGGRGWSVLN